MTVRLVADMLGIERPSAHRRYDELHEWGVLERGKLSPRVVIW